MIVAILLLQLVGLPLLLALAFPVVIGWRQATGWRRACLALLAAIDVWLNFTTLALYMLDWPRWGEWTFSKRLERLVCDAGWRGALARPVARYLNRFDSGHVAMQEDVHG